MLREAKRLPDEPIASASEALKKNVMCRSSVANESIRAAGATERELADEHTRAERSVARNGSVGGQCHRASDAKPYYQVRRSRISTAAFARRKSGPRVAQLAARSSTEPAQPRRTAEAASAGPATLRSRGPGPPQSRPPATAGRERRRQWLWRPYDFASRPWPLRCRSAPSS